MKKNTKILTIASTLCLSLAAVGIGAFAYFNDSKEDSNNATSGNVSIDLIEDFNGGKPTDEMGADVDEKTFWGVATGSKKSLARASIFVSVEYKNEETKKWEVLGTIPSNAVTFNISDATKQHWKEGNDGYWYYDTVLEGNPNASNAGYNPPTTHDPNAKYMTTKFEIDNVKISEEYEEQYLERTVRINMLVSMETCQATNGAYKLSWGEIPENLLPQGVFVP